MSTFLTVPFLKSIAKPTNATADILCLSSPTCSKPSVGSTSLQNDATLIGANSPPSSKNPLTHPISKPTPQVCSSAFLTKTRLVFLVHRYQNIIQLLQFSAAFFSYNRYRPVAKICLDLLSILQPQRYRTFLLWKVLRLELLRLLLHPPKSLS